MSTNSVLLLKRAIGLSESLKTEGKFVDALETLCDAIRIRFFGDGASAERLATPLSVDAIAIEKLADLSSLVGIVDGADDLLSSLSTWCGRTGNLYFVDYVSIKRVHIALGCGRRKRAIEILKSMQPTIGDLESIDLSESGLELWENGISLANTNAIDRKFLLACLLLEMGKALSSLGQYNDALTVLSRGAANAESCPRELAGNVGLHLKLAAVAALLEKGELAAAREGLNDLRPRLSAIERPGLFARSVEIEGKLDLLGGDLGSAKERFEQALSFLIANGLDRSAVAATLNIAHVLIYLNQTSAAQEILSLAEKKAADLEDEANVTRARFLLQMVQARSRSLADEVSVASPVVAMWGKQRSVATRQSGPVTDAGDPGQFLHPSVSFLSFFEDRVLAFQWRLASLDLDGARRLLADIQEIFACSDSSLIGLRLKILAGMLAYYRSDFSAAAEIFDESRPHLRELGLRPELWQAQRFLSWCWKKLRSPEPQQELLALDTQRLLSEMTESLPRAEQSIFLLNKWTADEEFIAVEINRLIKLKSELVRASWAERVKLKLRLWRQLHELLEHIDRYKDALARRAVQKVVQKDDAMFRTARTRSLWNRLLKHSRARATLSFLVMPDRVFIARAGWMSLQFGVSPITRIQIREIVREWHELMRAFLFDRRSRNLRASPSGEKPREERFIEGKPDPIQARLNAVAQRFASALQMPALLRDLPDRVRGLTIVPDDSLHGFPFAAMVHEGKYLIERFALSVAFESNISEKRSGRTNRDFALTVGVSQGAGRFPPLWGTEEELEHVSAWISRRGLKEQRLDDFRQDSARPNAAKVLGVLAGARLFHIACHGIFQPDAPDQSGMVLIPDAERIEILTLKELSALNLNGLRHTTLSSCWSADNFVLPGRWVISLPETLWRAGSESVVGCLWLVSDDVAVELIKRFYEYADRLPRDEALRRAQLDCLNGNLGACGIENRSLPFFWAGYTLYGSYRRLKL